MDEETINELVRERVKLANIRTEASLSFGYSPIGSRASGTALRTIEYTRNLDSSIAKVLEEKNETEADYLLNLFRKARIL